MITNGAIRFSILDPTGNITALVESPVPVEAQPETAAELMRRHPEVEQVGFVRFAEEPDALVHAELRMAGGEFCGNASICASALYLLNTGTDRTGTPADVRLSVSGAEQLVNVRLCQEADGEFSACLVYPPALSITAQLFSFGGFSETLPIVFMSGISHIIIRPGSVFFTLKEDRNAAEQALRTWCAGLSAAGLGLMFLEPEGTEYRLTPYVWVPGAGTFFRENSCASGSAAAAMVLAAESGEKTLVTLHEPGGCLKVSRDPASGETLLYNRVRLTARFDD